MKKIITLFLGISILLSGCNIPIDTPTSTSTMTFTPLPPTETATVTNTATITPTFTPAPTATSTWVYQGPNNVIVPILMYHHISISSTNSRYYKSPENFEEEIKLLQNWGYTTISTDLMVKAMYEGAELPPRPIIITFDDGNLNNYTAAFPIMQKYGYQGVLYLVANYIGADGFMNVDQIKEMASAGWEIGSHTLSHKDLITLDPTENIREIVDSKHILEDMLGVPVKTFAYPFGSFTESTIDYVRFAGYTSAMSISYRNDHIISGLFQLHRREIKGDYDLKNFSLFLSWQGDPAFLPSTETPVPEE